MAFIEALLVATETSDTTIAASLLDRLDGEHICVLRDTRWAVADSGDFASSETLDWKKP